MNHPYSDAPDYRRWRAGVADAAPGMLDPVVAFPFTIGYGQKIAAAGSCFAQHVARHLRARGFAFLDAEPAHPMLPADTAQAFGYGIFSARYGNLYTSRQLLQLLRRAYGRFAPADDVWSQDDGRCYDPFRPGIQPGGFATRREYDLDRAQHFAAVRSVFEQADVLIFTLGLTECWVSREDGAAYPMCPGTVAGEYDPLRHELLNLEVEDVESDMRMFIDELHAVNPSAKVILTVSPVPLAATALDRHVLVSTTASKAVLRVAAERLAKRPSVAYFPAYEIITAPSRGKGYFSENLRSIREEGVEHVMRCFFRHACGQEAGPESPLSDPSVDNEDFMARMQEVVDTLCEEAQLDSPPTPFDR
ncbi:MAG TPA: GSCFA domain-containing protein [Pseudoxanthomonas sp.]